MKRKYEITAHPLFGMLIRMEHEGKTIMILRGKNRNFDFWDEEWDLMDGPPSKQSFSLAGRSSTSRLNELMNFSTEFLAQFFPLRPRMTGVVSEQRAPTVH